MVHLMKSTKKMDIRDTIKNFYWIFTEKSFL